MSATEVMTSSLSVMQMWEKEKKRKSLQRKGMKTWKGLMKEGKRPKSAAADISKGWLKLMVE